MRAPLKVLLFSIAICVTLILVVLYKFDLLQFNKVPVETSDALVKNPEAESESESSSETQPQPTQAETTKIDLADGKKLYTKLNCHICHGTDGKAGNMGATDLTAKEYKNGPKSADYIYKVLENGVPGTAMVSFKNQLPTEQEKRDLSAYVASLK